MRKPCKRLAAFVLTAVMAVTAMGGTAFAAETPFTDVASTDWYRPYIDYAYTENLFVGTSATTFAPLRNISRAELVTALGNMHQKITGENPKTDAIESTFTDVQSGQYYTYYVGWAQKNGLVAGYPDGSFRPNELITREMLAVILNHYIEISSTDLKAENNTFSGYTDQDTISAWAADAVNAMTKYGFLSGLPDKSFAPKRNTTRAETCTVVTQVYQALKYQIEANVNYQYIRYDGDYQNPANIIDGNKSYRLISNYEDYSALVKAAQAQASTSEEDTFAPVTESYFETGNILAVELQCKGRPNYQTELCDYSESLTTGTVVGTASVTFFSKSSGVSADIPGYIFLIEVPKYIAYATVDEVYKVAMIDDMVY